MAVDLATGNLLPFVADTNGSVQRDRLRRRLALHRRDFTTVNGVARSRIAKLDLTTGAVDPTFIADVGARSTTWSSSAARCTSVGEFNTVDGVTAHHGRRGAARPTARSIPTFDPNTDGTIIALAASPDGSGLYLGGNFTQVGTTGRAVPGRGRRRRPARCEPDVRSGRRRRSSTCQLERRRARLRGRRRRFNSAAGWSRDHRSAAIRAAGRRRHAGRAVQQRLRLHGLPRRRTMSDISTTPAVLALDPSGERPTRRSMPASNSYPGVYGSTPTAAIWWPAATSPTWAVSA